MVWRVLYVDHADWMGGAEESLLLLLRHVDRRRVEPLLAAAPGAPLGEAARQAGVAVVEASLGRLRGRSLWAAGAELAAGVQALHGVVRQVRPHLLHANVARAAAYGAAVSLRSGAPLVWHVRDIHDRRRLTERALLQGVGRVARAIICPSRAVAQPLPGVAQRKVHVVPNGVDAAAFAPNPAERAAWRTVWGIAPEEVLVGTVGWLAPWKQPEQFLAMAERVAAACPQARFVVVGEAASPQYGSYVDGLRSRAAASLGQRLLFAGPQTAMPGVMAALDLLVHTARAEPFGRVLLEAMAAERPVVAYADGGVPEVLHGRLVPPGDQGALAAAVLELARQPALRTAMGRAGRAHVLAGFTAEAMARRTEAVYEAVLGRGRE
ncbi:MAG: glycosyltransferase [Chloroflexi bacterium]|nr:glycosyltransferase [Chloroflexota bacterium]